MCEWVVNIISITNSVCVLKQLKNSGHKLKYNKNAINGASKYKNDDILKWFKNNIYKTRLYYIKQYKH